MKSLKACKQSLLKKLKSLQWNSWKTVHAIFALSFLAYMLHICLPAHTSNWANKSEVLDPQDLKSIVMITGGGKMCSGSIIKDGLILTAKHCVMSPETGAQEETEEISFYDGRLQIGKVISVGEFEPITQTNNARDFALIMADTHDYPHFEISYAGLSYEDTYTIYGFHSEIMEFVLTKRSGPFLGYLRMVAPSDKMAIFGISVVPGNSGGPILNSKHQIVGVITAAPIDMGHVGLGVPIFYFKVNIENLPFDN